jgi:hypothetical protein
MRSGACCPAGHPESEFVDMRFSGPARLLSLAGALALAVLPVLSSGDGVAKAEDESTARLAALGARPHFADDDAGQACPSEYVRTHSGVTAYSIYDLNGNQFICARRYRFGTGQPVRVDDDGKLGCTGGYQLTRVPPGGYGETRDVNRNHHICVLRP